MSELFLDIRAIYLKYHLTTANIYKILFIYFSICSLQVYYNVYLTHLQMSKWITKVPTYVNRYLRNRLDIGWFPIAVVNAVLSYLFHLGTFNDI